MHKDKMSDDRRGLLIGGVITLGFGVIFLLDSFDVIPSFGEMWPLFPIVAGIALIIGAFVKGKKSDESDKPPE